jgi:hypothetical protein
MVLGFDRLIRSPPSPCSEEGHHILGGAAFGRENPLCRPHPRYHNTPPFTALSFSNTPSIADSFLAKERSGASAVVTAEPPLVAALPCNERSCKTKSGIPHVHQNRGGVFTGPRIP